MIDNLKLVEKSKCEDLNLDFEQIKMHQNLIVQSLSRDHWPDSIAIYDTCRMDNNGVLIFDSDQKIKFSNEKFDLNIAAFIPAAGASTRYLNPLSNLCAALESLDIGVIEEEFENLRQDIRSKNWILPKKIEEIKHRKNCISTLSSKEILELNKILKFPKALFPCNDLYQSFVSIKNLEHKLYKRIQKEIFITPPGQVDEFIKEVISNDKIETLFFEQNASMSTIRFDELGSPILDREGNYSMVPAGHGALIQLFPKLKKELPNIDCLFIRNSDNLSGMTNSSVKATEEFFETYNCIFSLVRNIRVNLRKEKIDLAIKASLEMAKLLKLDFTSEETSIELLWEIQTKLFCTPVSMFESKDMKVLLKLYDRPFNIMGMVPNNGTDVGGTPVFHRNAIDLLKVCLEVPHASDNDKKEFLQNPEKATHFNPVFVLAELQNHIEFYNAVEQSPFWLLVKKEWQGQQVRYFETVLYEIIGNSMMANVLFVEIPRILFNPNKTLDDSRKNIALTYPE